MPQEYSHEVLSGSTNGLAVKVTGTATAGAVTVHTAISGTKATRILDGLRPDADDLRAAIAALPAPASRNAAQRRDALMLRTLLRLVRWSIISAGAATAADLDTDPT